MSEGLPTTIVVMGGIGLFLLGMSIMTDGLKALAGPSLRTALGKAAATPLRGAFWGAIVTLLVQSSSAVTMTTIGLVSAGLLTFPQGLGLVFGANIGTTGTGWLVALIGVRVSLATYALPLIFIGALMKLLFEGRRGAAGLALAGFALVLYGLTTLQQGMGGLAANLHPSDLPPVLGTPGVDWITGSIGLTKLIVIGLAMTAVMQSSTASIAVTIAAYFVGAINLEQGSALIIGQNIGTATSSALAAIGASTTAKRLALAYILFKVITALIAFVIFPFTAALMQRLLPWADGTTLLAAYHTGYNVVGVAVLLPATQWLTRVVERILPGKETATERVLDPSSLVNPVVAVEAARRVLANVLTTMSVSVSSMLSGSRGATASPMLALETIEQVRDFLSELKELPETEMERFRLASTLDALDYIKRLVEGVADGPSLRPAGDTPQDRRLAELCDEAMRNAASIGRSTTEGTALSTQITAIDWTVSPEMADALSQAESASNALKAMQYGYRASTIASIAPGRLSATDAFARIDGARRLDKIAYHGWRAAAHLVGRGEPDDLTAQA